MRRNNMPTINKKLLDQADQHMKQGASLAAFNLLTEAVDSDSPTLPEPNFSATELQQKEDTLRFWQIYIQALARKEIAIEQSTKATLLNQAVEKMNDAFTAYNADPGALKVQRTDYPSKQGNTGERDAGQNKLLPAWFFQSPKRDVATRERVQKQVPTTKRQKTI